VVPTKGTPEPEETHERTWNTVKLDTAFYFTPTNALLSYKDVSVHKINIKTS